MGWSDGGITGLVLAATYPANVRKLVIWGASAYMTEQDIKAINAIRDTSKWSARAREAWVNVYGDYFYEIWPKIVDSYSQFGDMCKDDLKRIECPTFILHGDKDPLVPKEHPEYIHKNVKNSKLFCFPDGKHNIHQRYAAEFHKLVEEFLLE